MSGTDPSTGRAVEGRALRDLRQIALARAPAALLGMMLRRRLPGGTNYLNVGHSNLSHGNFAGVRRGLHGKTGIFLHDTIPLDHPAFCREDAPRKFARKLETVSRAADLVICSTEDVKAKAAPHLSRMGRVPPFLVAGLGADPVVPAPNEAPQAVDFRAPYFVAVGTIEPRKNHAFLLDLWADWPKEAGDGAVPTLVIAGRRGWANRDTFRRLDTGDFIGRTVIECPGLSDGGIAALMASATGLLFPSHAEGFGLPGVEAAALGCPVLCTDLAVFREVLGNYPIYLPNHDRYAWLHAMRTMIRAQRSGLRREIRPALDWATHFNRVFSAI